MGPVDDDRVSLMAGKDLDQMEVNVQNYWRLTPLTKEPLEPPLSQEVTVDIPLARDDTACPSAFKAPLTM